MHGLIWTGALLLIFSDAARVITPSQALEYSLNHEERWDMTSPDAYAKSQRPLILANLGSFDEHVPASNEKRNKPLTLKEASPAVLMATVAGLSTVLGALVVCCMPSGGVPRSAMSFGLSLAAGVMLTVSVMELWPEGSDENSTAKLRDMDYSKWGHDWHHIVLFLAGGLVTFVICKLASCLEANSGTDADPEFGDLSVKAVERRSWRLAILLFISLTAHNLPEGLAVAISAMADQRLGLIVMVAIAVHNIPEGVAVAIPTYDATKQRWKAIFIAFLSGMTETVGALIAIVALQSFLTRTLIEDLLVFVAGIMCYIACFELIPEAVRGGGELYAITCLGLLVGAIIMIGTHMLLEETLH
jgi:ZIP family zinc transporter